MFISFFIAFLCLSIASSRPAASVVPKMAYFALDRVKRMRPPPCDNQENWR